MSHPPIYFACECCIESGDEFTCHPHPEDVRLVETSSMWLCETCWDAVRSEDDPEFDTLPVAPWPYPEKQE